MLLCFIIFVHKSSKVKKNIDKFVIIITFILVILFILVLFLFLNQTHCFFITINKKLEMLDTNFGFNNKYILQSI